ncbi:MFS transporter [Nesterenkonia sp. MY13]|uniref:MFS transporter n=1 Tax=Nesterenkonia sedimenti TaxID=1463632 RepID=A0A7X8TI63_9MICC|nr:MFS transporter [Nesterenkonia sedimenti]NLS08895.1 MFS transporter [Nesterenkonia sedimenti]
MTFIALEFFAVTTVLPLVVADLDGQQWYALASAGAVVTGLLGMILAGGWADRAGPRPPLVIGGILFVTGIVLCAAAPHISIFVLGRLLQGIGGGLNSVVIYVLIGRKLHEDLRPALFALFSAAWLLPSMAGPLAAGTLAELTSWRIMFGIVSIGAALSLIGLIRSTRTEKPLETSGSGAADRVLLSRSMLWALLAAGAALALHLGGQSDGALTTVTALLLGGPLLMLAASRLLPAGTLRLVRGAPRLVVIRAVLAASSGATEIFLVLYMQSHRGLSATIAGLVIAVGATGWAVGAWYQGRSQTDENTDYRLITTGAVLVLAGPMAALLYVTGNAPLGVVVAGCALMGAGFGTLYPRITSATLRLAPQEQHGRFSSGLQAGESMATAGMLALAGAAATTFSAPASFILINTFAVAAVGFAATLTLSRPPLQPAVVP